MLFLNFAIGLLLAVGAAFGVNALLRKQNIRIPMPIWYVLWLLPFVAGGFHTFLAAVTVGILLGGLAVTVHREKVLKITRNVHSITFLILVAAYCVTPVWAADKGMAVFGIVRYLPVLLLMLLLMQYPKEQKQQWLQLLPLCGTAMTVISCVLWSIPSTAEMVSVNGRLSGFLQYPNTFAAFLLMGLAILSSRKLYERRENK